MSEELTGIPKGFYWDIHKKLLSYTNANVYIATGQRGVGKTFSCLKEFIKNYIDNGWQFAYIRRYKEDLGNPQKLVNDPALELYFPEYEFTAGAGEFKIRKKPQPDEQEPEWETMGAYKVLKQVGNAKGSVILDDCMTVWVDEFQIDIKDKRMTKYVTGEFDLVIGLFESFTRGRRSQNKNPRLFLTSNARSLRNPYFTGFHLQVDPDKEIIKHTIKQPGCRDIVVVLEQVKLEAFNQAKRKTVSGALLNLCSDAESSLNNVYVEDNMSFIQKRNRRLEAKIICNIDINNTVYGVYENIDGVFIDRVPSKAVPTYTPVSSNIREGVRFVKTGKSVYDIYYIWLAYQEEELFFGDLVCKGDIEDALNKWGLM